MDLLRLPLLNGKAVKVAPFRPKCSPRCVVEPYQASPVASGFLVARATLVIGAAACIGCHSSCVCEWLIPQALGTY